MLLQELFTVLGRAKDRVQLLKVFEVDLVEGGSAVLLKLAECVVEPSFRVLQIIYDFIFLFHLESVVFSCFLHNISQICHLFFIKGVGALALLQYVVEVPPKFFTNLHLGL